MNTNTIRSGGNNVGSQYSVEGEEVEYSVSVGAIPIILNISLDIPMTGGNPSLQIGVSMKVGE